MAYSINKSTLLGHVGKEPEFKFTPNGTAVASFSIATTEKWKDKQGQPQEKTEWHNVVAFQKLAEIIRDYVKKGSAIPSSRTALSKPN
jgi:single-strand DNA-binding protein